MIAGRWTVRTPLLAAALVTIAGFVGPAAAHHPTGGRMPANIVEGFLSGVGHPVIGPDHLAFIVAIGIAAALTPIGARLIAAFVAASLAGVLVHAGRLDIPLSEQVVALSVVAAGAMLAIGRAGSGPLWLALGTVAGLFHGYAFGEAIVGAERGVIGAYLAGITAIASIVAAAFMILTPRFIAPTTAEAPVRLRKLGAIVACIGVVMLAGGFVTG